MRFLEKINHRKITLISIFLFLYLIFNLIDGERGLISFYEKKKVINQLIEEKKSLEVKLDFFEKKNRLLTKNIDLDYLEILYRKMFMVGKIDEKIYIK